MINRIIAYTLFILGVLTMTFFRHYSGDLIPYPWVFFLIGILLFFVGFLLLRYPMTRQDTASLTRLRQAIADLKANGEKITVDLTGCEIRGNNYSEARDPSGANSLLVDFTTSHELRGIMDHLDDPNGNGRVNVQQSVLIYTNLNTRTGQTERFISAIIPKDEITLSFYLDRQRQTTLYIDRSDRSRYYFDLDFLFD